LGAAETPCRPERAARVMRTAVKVVNLENMMLALTESKLYSG